MAAIGRPSQNNSSAGGLPRWGAFELDRSDIGIVTSAGVRVVVVW